jgi:hypothetical protein
LGLEDKYGAELSSISSSAYSFTSVFSISEAVSNSSKVQEIYSSGGPSYKTYTSPQIP